MSCIDTDLLPKYQNSFKSEKCFADGRATRGQKDRSSNQDCLY